MRHYCPSRPTSLLWLGLFLSLVASGASAQVGFGPAANFPVGTNPDSVAVGEFNGDGKLDLATANFGSNNVSILLGNGDGTFAVAVPFSAGVNPVSVAVGFFNGDANQDLAVANFGGGVSILLGNGDGTFAVAVPFGAGAIPSFVAVGDFNGDGKQDLAVADFGSPNVSILIGNGLGAFAAAVSFPVAGLSYSVSVGDFNFDGKQDLAATNYYTANVSILLGDGLGAFAAAVNFGVGAGPISALVSDFNLDGKQDLAVSNDVSNDVSILLNILCAAGTWSPNGLSSPAACAPSTPGHFVAASGATSETDCAAGFFQPLSGQTSCNPSPAGSFVSATAATTATPCSAGFFQPLSGQISCNPSPAGSFVAGTGAIAAVPCSAGFFQASTAQTSCNPSPAGSFVAGTGAITAVPCSAGFFQASTAQTSCNPSPAGSFVAGTGATTAVPCSAGSFQPLGGQVSCNLAQVGFFVAGPGAISQTPCAPGFTSGTGATVCVPITTGLSVNDASVIEGNAGTNTVTFTVTRVGDTAAVTFDYVVQAVAPGPGIFPATVVTDFVAASGTLTIPAGAPGATTTIVVTTKGDTLNEENETFEVKLSNQTAGFLLDATGIGTITNDDNPPNITFAAVSVTEGNGGPVNATFNINLNAASGKTVMVTAATADNTAVEPGDYTAVGPTTFTFLPGEVLKQFVVPVIGDTLYEVNETFRVNLSAPVNAGLPTATRNGTITNDDTAPTVSIDSISVPEGTGAGNTAFNFTVSLDVVSGANVAVKASTVDVTAQGAASPATGFDYITRTLANVAIPAGSTIATFTVQVKKDSVPEPNETFNVVLSLATNSTIGTGTGVGTIENDDAGLAIGDAAANENGGSMVFTVTRTASSLVPVTFSWATANIAPANSLHAVGGVCGAGIDYATSGPSGGSISPSLGVATTTITVPLCPDATPEAHETFQVNLTSVVGATLTDGVGIGTINNDDALPAGALVISEFRANGPGLPAGGDEFVELANTTASPVTVGALDLSPGFSVWAADGTKLFTVPNGTTIPAYGHYLATGASYTLTNLGGTNAALGDTAFLAGLADNTGIALFAKDTNGGAPTDSVGFGADIYVETTGLGSISGPFAGKNVSFVRRHPYGGGPVVLDTNNNVTDFSLVANDGGTYGSTVAILGAPSPENLASPPERTVAEMGLILLDAGVDANTAPNYQFTPAGVSNSKFIELRRKVTSTANFGSVRFKATSLSTLNANNLGNQADFRPTTSLDVTPVLTTAFGVTLENGPIGYTTLGVPLATDVMGGLNSTLKFGPVTPGTPLVAGTPLGVNFKLFYTTIGKPGYYWVTIEAK